MPLSKTLSHSWRHTRKEWFSIGKKEKTEKVIKSENLAKNEILPRFGFNKVIRFGELNVRHGFKQRIFSFDIYAEKGKEKWLIEVTMNAQKRMDGAFIQVFRMIQPNLKIGVIHFKKDLKKYVFKEIGEKLLNKGNKNIVTRVTKDDFVLGNVKDV